MGTEFPQVVSDIRVKFSAQEGTLETQKKLEIIKRMTEFTALCIAFD